MTVRQLRPAHALRERLAELDAPFRFRAIHLQHRDAAVRVSTERERLTHTTKIMSAAMREKTASHRSSAEAKRFVSLV